jgi:aerobic carbon-monoxide dehydrogenase large subunit
VFPAGVHICEVDVDPDTGHTDIVSYTCVDDFGNLINPMIVEGQVQGGIAQGIGQALMEGCVYDDDSGQLLTGSYMDYTMPRARDLPHIENFKLGFTCTPCPTNPMGIKGCGEAGAIGSPPAVINAITDAIGVRDLAMPATSLAVWQSMQSMKKAAE